MPFLASLSLKCNCNITKAIGVNKYSKNTLFFTSIFLKTSGEEGYNWRDLEGNNSKINTNRKLYKILN